MKKRKKKRNLRRDRRHELKVSLEKNGNEEENPGKQKMLSRPKEKYIPKDRRLVKSSKIDRAELLTKDYSTETNKVEDPQIPFIPEFCVNTKEGYLEICLN